MTPIESRVDSVTLYHRGATVRRLATLDFPSGVPDELHIAGLPLSLLDHTVRARVEVDGASLVLSNVRVGLSAPPRGTPPVPPDEKALREVRARLEALADQTAQLEHELGQLGALEVNPRPSPEQGKPPTPSPMFARASLEAMVEESQTKRLEQLRALRVEEKRLRDDAAALERKLALTSTSTHVTPDELRKSITVQVLPGATAKKATLVLEYFVTGARWAPAYQCRMTRDCRSADLQLRAMVCQRTGEDWRTVQLKLSTAAPTSWTELPELSSIRIGRAQPPPSTRRGFRPPPTGAASLFGDYDRGLAQARARQSVIPSWQPPALEEPQVAMLGGPAPLRDVAEEEAAPELDDVAAEREVVTEKRASRRSAPMPPPAPVAAAAPRAAMARQSLAKMSKKEASVSAGASFSELEADGEGGAPGELEVLRYGTLRLGAPSHPSRGQLTPVDRRQAFLESLARLQLTAPFDVLSVVEAAEQQGQEVQHLPSPSGTSDVRSEAGWYDYVYPTDAAVDVPSDGTWHSVPVNTRTATSEVRYVVVPREDPQAYRQAQVRNPLPSPLLPGPVEVYVAGEYVLTTTLPPVPPGGDFKLALGVEQAIKVARNATFSEQRSGDKVVATTELLHDLVIELVNNLDREATFEVRERVPQPAPDAEVVVEEGKVSPAWEAWTQEERGQVLQGGRRWLLQVKPGATQTLKAHYRVKLYANNELVGGNRREA